MRKFLWFPSAFPGFKPELTGAHLVGVDGVPVRGEPRLERGSIVCDPRSADPVGLSLLWPVKGCGAYQLETTRLPLREPPHNLHVELVRHRLMRLSMKREEWGLFDYGGMDAIAGQIDEARDGFLAALAEVDVPKRAAALADDALCAAMRASDALALFHANVFLSRRLSSGAGRGQIGLSLTPESPVKPPLPDRLKDCFDFLRVPFVWREVQPAEGASNFDVAEGLVRAAHRCGLGVRGGPLLSFGVSSVPDWMYIYENDYEQIADYARQHIIRTMQRFSGQISSWVVASGLHADCVFPFSFEQIMDLTRLTFAAARQAAPRAQLVLELTQPWGEYYARNQRTVPPALYAEMAIQNGTSFDAFGVQLLFGLPSEGYHMRDLLQVSALIDRLANLGKPIHVTALAVPGCGKARDEVALLAEGGGIEGGWNETSQAAWLSAVTEVLMSKPYVESVCLPAYADAPDTAIPDCGLVRADATPKAAFDALREFRKRLLNDARK